MFRNPRENAGRPLESQVGPSSGRPPTPPNRSGSDGLIITPVKRNPPTQTTSVANSLKKTGLSSMQVKPKTPASRNGSILNFFKKSAEGESSNGSGFQPLFMDDTGSRHFPNPSDIVSSVEDDVMTENVPQQEDLYVQDRNSRYNKEEGSNKRRKLSLTPNEAADAAAHYSESASGVGRKACSPPPPDIADQEIPTVREETSSNSKIIAKQEMRNVGPFAHDSDSDEENPYLHSKRFEEYAASAESNVNAAHRAEAQNVAEGGQDEAGGTHHAPPSLRRASTSYAEQDGFAEFEGMDDFEDEYPEGEEFLQKRWYMEQRRLEMEEDGLDGVLDDNEDDAFRIYAGETGVDAEGDGNLSPPLEPDGSAPTCPVCGASFAGVSEQDASVHVNHCLDGNPTSLPQAPPPVKKEEEEQDAKPSPQASSAASKFRRPAKPGQQNPFTLGAASGTSSAFSKLMSGHAEDAAWASAAASEMASRGKPAYQRTCPFYKILPGFYICVDAFRYGAVEGCNAYFLSHFHSDHYVGLTATWSHGPIYCSRPTGNLVRQQLHVDPKWVVDLEFEKKVEVPGTEGVHVTMIPANHCPGSSLFLFEKGVGKSGAKAGRTQRVLHCGDFRACPAHVEHPLLKPDVVDAITGKSAQQKIDVCYLDTTYLNPKYAFPSQEDVIQACAELCVALDKDATGSVSEQAMTSSSSITNFIKPTTAAAEPSAKPPDQHSTPSSASANRLLVVVGTYSIGKERICLGIARALGSKIYAPQGKRRICACLEDPELSSRLTADPREAQVHMTPLFEIRAETLADYLTSLHPTFARAVAFRPSGWSYRPPGHRSLDSPAVASVLHGGSWRSAFAARDLAPQRGSTPRAATYAVPYSEHSSFRELTMFCCALRIDKVIPTVNVGSARSREAMKGWVDKWTAHKRKEGLFRVGGGGVGKDDEEGGGKDAVAAAAGGKKGAWYAGAGTMELRTTL